MTNNETIQIRIDSETKRESKKILNELGIDLSGAIKLFLKNVIHTKGIPLDLRTENGFTVAQEQQIIKEVEYAEKHGKRYTSAEEFMAHLEN